MTKLVSLSGYEAEALVLCLAASFVWAAALYVGAKALDRSGRSAERIWTGALLLAVLPSLLAPMLASYGVTLRAAPPPLDIPLAIDIATASPGQVAPMDADAAPLAMFTAARAIEAAAILYIYGAALAFLIWAVRVLAFAYAVSRAEKVANPALLSRFEAWARRIGVERAPDIRRSRHVASVCVFGTVRPVIVIPEEIEARLSSNDLVMMCAHELAHVRRGDTRLFTATALARILFWFNPLVARIASGAELAAERGADALVLSAGADRRQYAACFVEGLKFAAARIASQPALAPSFTPQGRGGRRKRLDSILSDAGERRMSLASRLMLGGATSAAALLALGQAAFAVNPQSKAMREPLFEKAPVEGDVTLDFGEKIDGAIGAARPAHEGIDIKAAKGTPVKAASDGVVVEATSRHQGEESWGKVVVLDHGHGLVTRYAHLDRLDVRKGDVVEAGDVIGAVGETGLATGPHLHFETLKDGAPMNPAAAVAEAPAAPAPAPSAAPVAPRRFTLLAPEAPAVIEFDQNSDEPTVRALAHAPRAFVSGGGFEKLAADLERALEGGLGATESVNAVISIDGEEILRFDSDEPMTPKMRAEIREVVKKIRKEAAAARDEARERAGEAARAAAERFEFRDARASAQAFSWDGEDFSWNEDDYVVDEEAWRAEVEQARRDALDAQAAAIAEARASLDEAANEAVSDAFEGLDDARADLDDSGLSDEEREAALRALEEARREVAESLRRHERAIEQARRELDAQQRQIDRMRRDLGRRSEQG